MVVSSGPRMQPVPTPRTAALPEDTTATWPDDMEPALCDRLSRHA